MILNVTLIAIVLLHAALLGFLFYVEEVLFAKLGWEDNRFVERMISIGQGLVLGSALVMTLVSTTSLSILLD